MGDIREAWGRTLPVLSRVRDPLRGSSHLSWLMASSRLGAAVIQYRNTRICCHWKSSLFPVTSELKFPHHFTKKKIKTLSEEADVKGRKWASATQREEWWLLFVWIRSILSLFVEVGRDPWLFPSKAHRVLNWLLAGRTCSLALQRTRKQLYRPCALFDNQAMWCWVIACTLRQRKRFRK